MGHENDVRTLGRLRQQLLGGDISRRGFLTAAMGLSSAALLSGCVGGLRQATGGSVGDPKVIPLYTVENDPATLAFYNMVIAKFEDAHPGHKVTVTVYSDSNQLQYLTTAFQNGVDVGIFSPPVSSFPDFQSAGHLADIGDVIARVGVDDFLPGTRVLIGGNDYGMPLQSNSSLVYYRKDLLEKAGLTEPKTYDEYLNAIRTLHGQDGRIGIAMAIGATPQLPLQFFAPYIYQSGWDYFDADGNLTFDQPEVLDAVRRFTDVMQHTSQSLKNAEFGDIVNAYTAGQAAFATFPGRLGVALTEKAPDIAANTGVMPIPAGPYKTGQLHFGSGQQYGLFSRTANPELAKELLIMLTTGDDALEFALTVPGHLLPPLKSVQTKLRERMAGGGDDYIHQHSDWMETFLGQVENAMTSSVSMGAVTDHTFEGKTLNLMPWATGIWPSPAIDSDMFSEILLNGVAPDQAWQKACERMRTVSDDWKTKNPGWHPEVSR
ncbi:ABC transporter substrate-binding protein [Propionibacteriaceae bacterium Y1685]